MEFRKITDNGAIELEWETEDEKGAKVSHHLKGKERPLKPFVSAMKAFVPLVAAAMGFNSAQRDGITVIKVSLSREKDTDLRGIVVTFKLECPVPKAPATINTPYLREKPEGAEGGKGYMPDSWMAAIYELELQAKAYQSGQREQAEMFDKQEMGTPVEAGV